MGVHDMGWTERAIFGKIRYMNLAGCQRKFKVADFVKKYLPSRSSGAGAGGGVAKFFSKKNSKAS